MQKILLLFVVLIVPATCVPQSAKGGKRIAADCRAAIPILLNGTYIYGPTVPPSGCGTEQEIGKRTKGAFEEEHNSAWYLLTIGRDGALGFDIIPTDTADDYDFVVYKFDDTTFCRNLQSGKLRPVRSNLSNVAKSKKGVTGLNLSGSSQSVGKGPGAAFSRTIDVRQGEKYILIVDNVHPGGSGHTLRFSYLRDVHIAGTVVGNDSLPLVGDVVLSDETGRQLAATTTDRTGRYGFHTTIAENTDYHLTISSDSTFVQSTIINTKQLASGASTFPDIKTLLPKLRSGGKYTLGNINFYPDSPVLLPASMPSAQALLKLMSKNKKMMIEIDGHTNGFDWKRKVPDNHEQLLSEERAKTIFDYLKNHGIAASRMKMKGFGSTQPFVKSDNPTPGEQESNRRVEIKVISVD